MTTESQKAYQRKYYQKNKHKILKWADLTVEQKKRKIKVGEIWRNKDTLKSMEYRERKRVKNQNYLKRRISSEPWFKTYMSIAHRCSKSHNWSNIYYFRGIRCEINSDELKELWFRDKAYKMKRPSIDRIDSNKSYSFNNCRYLELSENCRLATASLKRDNSGRFIKKYHVEGT